MKNLCLLCLAILLLTDCQAQPNTSLPENEPQLIGGPCEGCEAAFEYGDRELAAVDTLYGFADTGQRIRISGTVYHSDGETPAPGTVLYLYHTDQGGEYTPSPGATGWARRHGLRRTWIQTDENGRYTFYTIKPGIYPNRSAPAHIHLTVLEPNGRYYWLQSYHFSDDPLLSTAERSPKRPRGGHSGVMELRQEGDLWVAERDIILGRNVE